MKKLAITFALITPMVLSAEILFYCKTTKGKQVKIEKQGNMIAYAFGRDLKKPELALRKAIQDVIINNESFPNGASEQFIDIPNDGYNYRITNSTVYEYDKQHRRVWRQEASIEVNKGNDRLAELTCQEKTIQPSDI